MAKKKEAISDQLLAIPQGDGISEEQDAISEEEVKQVELPYEIGTWAGMKQYRCKQCSFDTLELSVMELHMFDVHSILII